MKRTPGNWYPKEPCYVMSDHEGLIEGSHTIVCRTTNIQDTHLIAQAPALLEALEDLLSWDTLAPAESIKNAQAVIKAARGDV